MGRIKDKLQQNTLKEVLSGIRMIAGNKAPNGGGELTREKAKSLFKKKRKKKNESSMWRTRPVCIHSHRLPALIRSHHNNVTDCCLPAEHQARPHFFSRALPPAVTIVSGLATSLWRARKDKGFQVAKWRKGSLMKKWRAGRGGKKVSVAKKVAQIKNKSRADMNNKLDRCQNIEACRKWELVVLAKSASRRWGWFLRRR